MGCTFSTEARADTLLSAIDCGNADTLRAVLQANKSLANGPRADPSPFFLPEGVVIYQRCPLFRALVAQQPYFAELLLQCGAESNVKLDAHGTTLLHVAVQRDDPAFINLLLRYEAKIDERNSGGETPLHTAAACKNCSATAAQVLLAASADTQAGNKYGHTPLVLAVESGNLAVLNLLLDATPGALSKIGKAGLTLLDEACRVGSPATVTALLSAGADPNALAINGRTSLLVAVVNGNAAVANALLNGGASPNLASSTGLSPMHVACSGGHLQCVVLLLDAGAEVSQKSCLDHSPLDYAAWAGAASVVDLLLCRGAQARTDSGLTLLHEDACRKARAEVALLREACHAGPCRAVSETRTGGRGGGLVYYTGTLASIQEPWQFAFTESQVRASRTCEQCEVAVV